MLADGLYLRYCLPKPKVASGYLTSQRTQSEPGTWRLSFKYKDAGPEWNKKMSPSRQRECGMKIPYLPFR